MDGGLQGQTLEFRHPPPLHVDHRLVALTAGPIAQGKLQIRHLVHRVAVLAITPDGVADFFKKGRRHIAAGDISLWIIKHEDHSVLRFVRREEPHEGSVVAPGVVRAVDEFAGCTGLADGLHAFEFRLLAGAVGNDALHYFAHQRRRFFADDLLASQGFRFLQQLALVVVDVLHQEGPHQLAAVGHGTTGHENLQGARRKAVPERESNLGREGPAIRRNEPARCLSGKIETRWLTKSKGPQVPVVIRGINSEPELGGTDVGTLRKDFLEGDNTVGVGVRHRDVIAEIPSSRPAVNLFAQVHLALLQRDGGGENLHGGARLVGVLHGMHLASELLTLLLYFQFRALCLIQIRHWPVHEFRGKDVIGIEGGRASHGQDLAGVGIHHHRIGGLGMTQAHTFFKGFLHDVLDGGVNGELHAHPVHRHLGVVFLKDEEVPFRIARRDERALHA